jgi:integrase
MAVYDRWHCDPEPGAQPCKCGRGRNRLYPSAVHLKGDRWQVRWRNPAGKQKKRNFAERDGKDPERYADAFDKVIAASILNRTYIDPSAGEVTLQEYAEQLRKARKIHNEETAADLEGRLRLHVYEGEPESGLTPRGAPSIGQHPMGLLASRPSIVAAWAAAIPLSPIRARHVMGDVSYVFRVGVADSVVQRDPLRMEGVPWPKGGPAPARPWSLAQLEAMRAELPERYAVLLDIGAATGQRQGEMLGLGTDDVDWLKRDDPRVRVVRQLKFLGGIPYFAPLKNRKPHSAPLTPELKTRLAAHLERFPAVAVTLPWHDPEDKQRDGKPVTVRLIVTGPSGRPVLGNSLNNTWRRAARRAGVTPEDGSPRADGCHALRHTFVSVQLRRGVDIVRVAEFIGDSVKTVVDTYAHFMPGGDDGDARAAVDEFFTPVPGDGACAPEVPSQEGDAL